MGSKYTSQATTGYNSAAPSDDGSTTEANKVKWSTIKTKLADVLKTFGEAINTALVTALDVSVGTTSTNYTTQTSDHQKPILCTNTITISLCDAVTAAVGYQATVVNVGTGVVTVGVITAANTLNGTANGTLKLGPGEALTAETNATPNGYNVIGGYGPWQLLAVGTTSSSATLDFTGLTGYAAYAFDLSLVRPATDNVLLHMRVSVDNGSNWIAGAADYLYAVTGVGSGATTGILSSAGAAQIALINGVGNNSSHGIGGRILVPGLSVAKVKQFTWNLSCLTNTGTLLSGAGGGAYIAATTAINGVRFLMSSGNIADGVIRCYGLRG